MVERNEIPCEFDFEMFMKYMTAMNKAEEDSDELTSDSNKRIVLEMLRRENTEGLDKLAHGIIAERSKLYGNFDDSAARTLSFAEGFRRKVIMEKAQKVLAEEVGRDWSKVATRLPMTFRSADSGRAEIYGVPYVEVPLDLSKLEDPNAFVARFEDREPETIRMTDVVNGRVYAYVPLDYVMYKEGAVEVGPEPVSGELDEAVQESRVGISEAFGGKAGE